MRLRFSVLGLCAAACLGSAMAGGYYGALREVPITDITPQGWLAELLQRQRNGLGLHHAVSGDPFDTCLWNGKMPHQTWDRYEQTAYLVDGLYRCGLLLKDTDLIKLGRDNVDYVLNNPQPSDELGPAEIGPISAKLIGLATIDGKIPPTQWPMAVFTRALMAHYSATGDRKVLDALTAHYLSLPDTFGIAPRDVNNIEGMVWLYEQTGDKRLVTLAERTWRNATVSPNENAKLKTQWDLDNLAAAQPMKGHGVSVNEMSKQPALLYLATGKKEYLNASLGAFRSMERDHELADGIVSSDEGLHGKRPDGVHETCDISDATWSMGYLLEASGDARWADKVERGVLNAGLGAIDKDFKALQYFSSPNQVVSTQDSLDIRVNFPPEHRDRQSYRPEFITQCCTGNVHRMIPNYVARMWMRDAQGGIAAVLYGPGKLATKDLTITETTDYPFDGKIDFAFECAKPITTAFLLRIPEWAKGAKLSVNGEPVNIELTPGTFAKLDRTFTSGDRVTLDLPMDVRLENPVPEGLAIARGPLVYSLKIDEKRTPVSARKNDPAFPAWNITPASPWNYTLATADPKTISVSSQPVRGFPWTPQTSPVVLTVAARRIPAWTVSPDGKQTAPPKASFETAPETEQIQLIPDGATQIRLTVFPTNTTP